MKSRSISPSPQPSPRWGEGDVGAGARDGAILAWLGLVAVLVGLALLTLYVFGSAVGGSGVPANLAILLTAYSPALAAVAVSACWPGGGGAGRLLRQVLRWRVHPSWFVLAMAGPTVLVLAAVKLDLVLGAAPPARLIGVPAGFGLVLGSLVSGMVGEEPGWRGFAQAGLQRRHGALVAALLVGLVWATWHLWDWLAPGGGRDFSWLVLISTYVRMVSTAVVYAWLYNSTGGSLPVVMLAHLGHNLAVQFVGGADEAELVIAVLYFLVAAAVVLVTQGRLRSPRLTARRGSD